MYYEALRAYVVPAVHDWDNASLPLSNFHESGLGHIKMGPRRVAPASGVGVLGPVWWTKVGSGHRGELNISKACTSPITFYLVTSSTSISIVE